MKKRYLSFSLLLVVVLLSSSLWVVQAPSTAQEPGSLDPDQRLVVRLYFDSREHLDQVAGRIDIWDVQAKGGYAEASVSQAQYDWLQELGYRVEIDVEKTARASIEAPLDPRFYYFDDYYPNVNNRYMVDFMQDINASYPGLAELYDIGDAWMAGQPGEYQRDIWVLRISNEDPAYGPIEDKPAFYLFGGIHAREVAIPELLIRYIKYLTTGFEGEGGYNVDPDVTWLVDHNVIYVHLSQNPDGHWMNEQDISNDRRKNMDNDDGCSVPSSWGVDLNRNHSFFWGCCGGSSGEPCDILYRGPAAASEPETQAFQNYFGTVMLDQNGPNDDNTIAPASPMTTTGIFISMHSYSDLVLWPWDLPQPPPNEIELTTIGRKLGYWTGYSPGPLGYSVDGPTDDWVYGKFGVPAFTFEVGSGSGACGGFFPAYGCIDGIDGMSRNFWDENLPAFLWTHKIARTPFATAYGPDAQDLAAMPGATAPGTQVTLTATIADHRYGADPLQPIQGAEYFVGAPGDDGSGIAMTASDGSWGDLSEVVEGTVDTTGWAPGQHYVLVHGLNDDGDWGPFTALFIYIVDPTVSPVIEGYVRDAITSLPLEATVSAGSFQDVTEPASGYYSMTVISGTYDVSAVSAGYAISTVTGIEAHDLQTVRQDFYLQPVCEGFADDMESGDGNWSHQADQGTDYWALSTDQAYSPTHSWHVPDSSSITDSYLWNSILLPVDESSFLTFWHRHQFEGSYDGSVLEISTDGGGTWTDLGPHITANGYNGTLSSSYGNPLGGRDAWVSDLTTWTQVEVDLGSFAGQNARFRWRIGCDSSVSDTGWYIDDVVLWNSGSACVAPVAPVAEFTSNSPVTLGEPTVLENLTTGSIPIDFWWDFGDGAGTSTETNPSYTYLAAGAYTVTLVATNTVGNDSVSHPVVVQESVCTPVDGVSLTLVTTGTLNPGDSAVFSVDVAPDDAAKPYAYSVDYDDGTLPDAGSSVDDPLLLTHTFAATGTFDVVVSVENCAMSEPLTDSLEITVYEEGACVDLTGITIHGPVSGWPGTYTFTTSYEPLGASWPFAYAWDNGDVEAVSSRSLDVGTHTLAVAVTNCASALVTDTHTILIDRLPFSVYLPVILRDSP